MKKPFFILIALLCICCAAALLWGIAENRSAPGAQDCWLYIGPRGSQYRHPTLLQLEQFNLLPLEYIFSTDLRDAALQLQVSGYLRDQIVFRYCAALNKLSGSLRSGWYQLPAGLSANQLARHLRKGPVRVKLISILPGYTTDQLSHIFLSSRLTAARQDLYDAMRRQSLRAVIRTRYGAAPDSLQGYLAPGLYIIEEDSGTMDDVLRASIDRFHGLIGEPAAAAGRARQVPAAVSASIAGSKAAAVFPEHILLRLQ